VPSLDRCESRDDWQQEEEQVNGAMLNLEGAVLGLLLPLFKWDLGLGHLLP
jgi:hypothetical protein